jgi:hypothetical protein
MLPTAWENPAADAMQRQWFGESLQTQRVFDLIQMQGDWRVPANTQRVK